MKISPALFAVVLCCGLQRSQPVAAKLTKIDPRGVPASDDRPARRLR